MNPLFTIIYLALESFLLKILFFILRNKIMFIFQEQERLYFLQLIYFPNISHSLFFSIECFRIFTL